MPDNKLAEQNGEKNDESNEKYVIYEKAETEEYEDGDKKDESEKQMKNLDKKISSEKLPPGWEKHEGELLSHKFTFFVICWMCKKFFFSLFDFVSVCSLAKFWEFFLLRNYVTLGRLIKKKI